MSTDAHAAQPERAARIVAWLGSRPPALWRTLAIAILAALSLAALFVNSLEIDGTRYFWLDDDQMISMRYARNLVEGLGPVFNAGERVEGYTNPGWMLVMAAVHWLPLADAHTSVVVKAISFGLAVWILWLAEALLRVLRPDPGLALPALLLPLACCYDLVRWSVHGFETTLLTALFLAALVGILRESTSGRAHWLPYLLLGLVPVVRSDGYHLFGAAALLAVFTSQDRTRTMRLLALAALPPLAHLGFRISYYGELLPNTYTLKVVGNPIADRLLRGLRYVTIFLLSYGGAAAVALLGAGGRTFRQRSWLLLGFGLSCLYVVWVGGDMFHGARFLAPWVPVLLVLALAGIDRIAGAGAGRGLSEAALTILLLLALAIPPLLSRVYGGGAPLLLARNGGPEQSLVTAIAIRDNSAPDARVAVHAAGIVPYFARRHAIDWLGKTDRVVARMPPFDDRVGHNKVDAEHSLGAERADLAVMLWLPRGVARCTDADRARVVDQAARWVSRIYMSLIFQSDFCNRAIELPGAVPIYVSRNSPEAARHTGWRAPERRGSGTRGER